MCSTLLSVSTKVAYLHEAKANPVKLEITSDTNMVAITSCCMHVTERPQCNIEQLRASSATLLVQLSGFPVKAP